MDSVLTLLVRLFLSTKNKEKMKNRISKYKGIIPFWAEVSGANLKTDSVTYFMMDNREYLRLLAERGKVSAYTIEGVLLTANRLLMAKDLYFYVTLVSKAWYVEGEKVSPNSKAHVLIY